MSDNLNPIFQDILKGIAPEQSQKAKLPTSVAFVRDLLDYLKDNCDLDDLFWMGEEFAALRAAIAENPAELCGLIKVFEKKIEADLDELDFCPDCGTHLEWEHDSKYDTYVPYGSTSVLESEGGCMKCPNCGHKKEN